jgi:hypothetical protein
MSAMLVSLISASPSLPASLVGPMAEMRSSGVPYEGGPDEKSGRRI